MQTDKLDDLKAEILYFVKNGMIDSQEYKLTLKKYIYEIEDEVGERNQDHLYNTIRFLSKNKAVARNVQADMLTITFICYLTAPKMRFISRLTALKSAHNGQVIKRVYPKKRGWNIVDRDGNLIKIALVSKSMPSLTKEIVDRLESGTKRMGYCHYDSMQLVRYILNKDANVVTGNVAYFHDEDSYSHSWIEYKSQKENKDMVLDFTMNAIMTKEDYYRLRNPQVLSVVSREKIKEAIEELKLFDNNAPLQNIDNKVLLLFFDEIVEMSRQSIQEKEQPKQKG